jgi:hypothetical protein
MFHQFLQEEFMFVIFWNKSLLDLSLVFLNLSHATNQISEIKLCENEVEDVLKVINPTKVSGPDLINPRLLKEATPIIKHSLCKLFTLFAGRFLSKSMEKSKYKNLFNYVPPVFARRIHVCNFFD